MKVFWKIVYLVVNVIIVFGLIAPYLISSASDLLVILGVVIIVVDVYFLGKTVESIKIMNK